MTVRELIQLLLTFDDLEREVFIKSDYLDARGINKTTHAAQIKRVNIVTYTNPIIIIDKQELTRHL